MADNNSVVSQVSWPLQKQIDDRVIIVQMLVMIFLCINMLLIVTFSRKECFYTTTRYILFAVTLVCDSTVLLVSNMLLILNYFHIPMQVAFCVIPFFIISLYYITTPVTLTAMTLERYVAICMPLRHGELCSTRSTVHCILIIHGLSSLPSIVVLIISFASASTSFYSESRVCSLEIFYLLTWQEHIWSAINLFYFLIMCITIVFAYIKIVKVAKAASGEDKKSTWRGLRTVILHGFQLLLCLIQLWCPFIENAVMQIDFILFTKIRYFNYVLFGLAPRCLSPLIYGLRDEKFFLELKSYTCLSLYKRNY